MTLYCWGSYASLMALAPVVWRLITWLWELGHYLDFIQAQPQKPNTMSSSEIRSLVATEIENLQGRLENTLDEHTSEVHRRLKKIRKLCQQQQKTRSSKKKKP